MGLMSPCLSRSDASISMQYDLLRSLRAFLLGSDFKVDLLRSSCMPMFDSSSQAQHNGAMVSILFFHNLKTVKVTFTQKYFYSSND